MPEKYPKIPQNRPLMNAPERDFCLENQKLISEAATIDPAAAKLVAPTPPSPRVDTSSTEDGQMIDGRYRLVEQLGQGGMGTVYRATHALMEKTVAIKVIHGALVHSDAITRRFEREAKSASRLTDPHCINVTDFGRTNDGKLFLVMEYLSGETLSERLRKTSPLPVEKAIQIIRHILKALAHAHQAGVVHRDLKPDNVMLVTHGDEADFVKVYDFGIAKMASVDDGEENITQTGLVLGTPSYLSPEQGTGQETDHRADLYAAGVILYEMLAGSRPFKGSSAMNIVLAHVSSPIPSLPRSCNAPLALENVIKKALAKKPADRFSSAEQFISALDNIDLSTQKRRSNPFALRRLVYPVRNFFARLSSRRLHRIPTSIRQRLEQLDVSSLSTISQPIKVSLAKIEPGKRRLLLTGFFALALVCITLATALWMGAKTDHGWSPLDNPFESSGAGDKKLIALVESAQSQIRTGDAKKASLSARRALRRNPNHPGAHLLLGHSLFLRGDRLGATRSYSRALELDRSLAADQTLGEHLQEALKHPKSRENAASILAEFSGAKGIEILASRANSSRASGDERAVARRALIVTNNEQAIDWAASLSADFHEYNSCAKRREIVAQMEETGNPRFLPLLKKELRRPTTPHATQKPQEEPSNAFQRLKAKLRKDKPPRCPIENDIRRAYRTLNRQKKNSDP